jgi:hypothetical protein
VLSLADWMVEPSERRLVDRMAEHWAYPSVASLAARLVALKVGK